MDSRSSDDDPPREPPLRLREDPYLWGKIAALWHRERAREEYRTAGFDGPEARRRANEEALDVARAHGYRGGLYDLKGELADLLVHHRGPAHRRNGQTSTWEDGVDRVMMRLLALDLDELGPALRGWLLEEVAEHGPFRGRVGLYKLAYIIGFVPPLEQLGQRNAFIAVLAEIAHHRGCCEPGLFNVVFRLSRSYTLKSLDERLGTGEGRSGPSAGRRVARWLPAWLRSEP